MQLPAVRMDKEVRSKISYANLMTLKCGRKKETADIASQRVKILCTRRASCTMWVP